MDLNVNSFDYKSGKTLSKFINLLISLNKITSVSFWFSNQHLFHDAIR